MATRKVIKYGDETLRKISKPVTIFDSHLSQLLDDMHETMINNDGAGLSAVQIGVLRRVFIIDVGDGLTEFINPNILKVSGKNKFLIEGCLSVPGKSGSVNRPNVVEIEAFDRNGKKFTFVGKGFAAKALCHENDHLNGILFIDKLIKNEKKD